jgi:tRNA-modifying protein YgfZ
MAPRAVGPAMLLDVHLPLGGRIGPAGGAKAVLDYAPLDQEAPRLDKVGLADWGFHGVLTVRGRDAAPKFLGNLLTSDAASLAVGQAQPSLLLDPKGKVVGMFRVWNHGGEHLDLLVEAACFSQAKAALQRYATVGKVALEDRSDELGVLLVQGPKAGEVIQAALQTEPPKEGRVVETPAGNVLAHDALASAPAYLLVVRDDQAREAWERLLDAARNRGGGPVGWHAVEAARVRAGVPRYGAEATLERLPGEAGLDGAISYTKGCFVGQEPVARIKNLGHVNRRAVRLQPQQPCEEGDAVRSGDKDVGVVTSVARGPGALAALAVVRREVAQEGAEVALPGGMARIAGFAAL